MQSDLSLEKVSLHLNNLSLLWVKLVDLKRLLPLICWVSLIFALMISEWQLILSTAVRTALLIGLSISSSCLVVIWLISASNSVRENSVVILGQSGTTKDDIMTNILNLPHLIHWPSVSQVSLSWTLLEKLLVCGFSFTIVQEMCPVQYYLNEICYGRVLMRLKFGVLISQQIPTLCCTLIFTFAPWVLDMT